MINLKTQKEIDSMAKGGKILADVLFEVVEQVKPGISELEIEEMAALLIKKYGGKPAFQRVRGYKYATCISTNSAVVHGIPTPYRFQEGDVVGVDCGVYLEGFNTDMAQTVRVATRKKDDVDMFLETGKKALEEAIKVAKIGNRIGHISQTIQKIVEGRGYSVVRSLIGHGVGKMLHEEPEVPGYLAKKIENTPLLVEGMTIAIEVIYNMGKPEVVYANNDGWTIKTKDDSLSGVFERTVAITSHGTVVLTK